MIFGPNTVMTFECESCGFKEEVRCRDMPATPKGRFMLPVIAQCIMCLRQVGIVVRKPELQIYG
jgi:hypothetical protein